MKDDKQIEIQTSNNFLWSIIFIFLILGSVFVVRQMLYVPVNTTTVKAFVLDVIRASISFGLRRRGRSIRNSW